MVILATTAITTTTTTTVTTNMSQHTVYTPFSNYTSEQINGMVILVDTPVTINGQVISVNTPVNNGVVEDQLMLPAITTTSTTPTTSTVSKVPNPFTQVGPDHPPMFLTSVKGVETKASYFGLDKTQCEILERINDELAKYNAKGYLEKEEMIPFPKKKEHIWIRQDLISCILFGMGGVRRLLDVEKHYGRFFLWSFKFSNVHDKFHFIEPEIIINHVTYPGPEQYFQGEKSTGMPDHEKIVKQMATASPMRSFEIGRHGSCRPDWENVKDDVMKVATYAKFNQHDELKNLLIETHGHLLVQFKPGDDYWGTGPNGTGLNRLGDILMEQRNFFVIDTQINEENMTKPTININFAI